MDSESVPPSSIGNAIIAEDVSEVVVAEAEGGVGQGAAASIDDTMSAINAACRAKGAGYSCKTVSWDDASRGSNEGGLSCWGSNITDTYLKSKEGTRLFTVRSDNWNEKLGKLPASEVLLVSGNQAPGAMTGTESLTLQDFLFNASVYGGYAGLQSRNLYTSALDAECSIRFQTTFLPVEGSKDGRSTIQFATESYNYNTHSDVDPKNLLLLCTSQGLAVQQDARGPQRIYHHAVETDGKVHRYWLEAEQTRHKVGGEQHETLEERAEALSRGKAVTARVGTRALGERFNVLMTVQVPLKQKPALGARCQYCCCYPMSGGGGCGGGGCGGGGCGGGGGGGGCGGCGGGCGAGETAPVVMAEAAVGQANAARVSRGDKLDTFEGLQVKTPERHPSEHCTITIVIYNTIAGGVPSESDVFAAIDDMEELYAACDREGQLAETKFNFMKDDQTSDPREDGQASEQLQLLDYLITPALQQVPFFQWASEFLNSASDEKLIDCVHIYYDFLLQSLTTGREPGSPSREIELIWRAHLLRPKSYAEDCKVLRAFAATKSSTGLLKPQIDACFADGTAAGTAIDHSPEAIDRYQHDAQLTNASWSRPEQPSAKHWPQEIWFVELAQKTRHDMNFMQHVLELESSGALDPQKLCAQLPAYLAYLRQVSKAPRGVITPVPSKLLDLIWHTHQLHPWRYATECETLVGCVINHIPDND